MGNILGNYKEATSVSHYNKWRARQAVYKELVKRHDEKMVSAYYQCIKAVLDCADREVVLAKYTMRDGHCICNECGSEGATPFAVEHDVYCNAGFNDAQRKASLWEHI